MSTAFNALQTRLLTQPQTWLITGVAGFIGSNLLETLLKLDQRVDTLTHAVSSVGEVGVTARAVGEETMPRMNALMDDVSKETRTLGRVINTLGDNPQSIVFGTPPGRPGPGEPGFAGGR